MAIQFLPQGSPIGQVTAGSPHTTDLLQPGQAPLGRVLLQEGIDGVPDQGTLAAPTAQGEGPQPAALRFRQIDLRALQGR